MAAVELDPEYFIEQLVNDDSIFKEISENQKMLGIEASWMLEKEDWMK